MCAEGQCKAGKDVPAGAGAVRPRQRVRPAPARRRPLRCYLRTIVLQPGPETVRAARGPLDEQPECLADRSAPRAARCAARPSGASSPCSRARSDDRRSKPRARAPARRCGSRRSAPLHRAPVRRSRARGRWARSVAEPCMGHGGMDVEQRGRRQRLALAHRVHGLQAAGGRQRAALDQPCDQPAHGLAERRPRRRDANQLGSEMRGDIHRPPLTTSSTSSATVAGSSTRPRRVMISVCECSSTGQSCTHAPLGAARARGGARASGPRSRRSPRARSASC